MLDSPEKFFIQIELSKFKSGGYALFYINRKSEKYSRLGPGRQSFHRRNPASTIMKEKRWMQPSLQFELL